MPRSTNLNGRQIISTAEVSENDAEDDKVGELVERVCYQHRYELFMLPLSVQYRWPRRVDFSKLLQRLESPKAFTALKDLYNAPWTAVNIRKGGGKYKERLIKKLVGRLVHEPTQLKSAG